MAKAIVKMELIAKMHKTILGNVEKAQKNKEIPMLQDKGNTC